MLNSLSIFYRKKLNRMKIHFTTITNMPSIMMGMNMNTNTGGAP
jgi:hypothetical protein